MRSPLAFLIAFVVFSPALLRAAPVQEHIGKHWDAFAIATDDETLPNPPPSRWGKWHFWNGQWWAKTMFQKETTGVSFDPPDFGYNGIWQKPKGVWLKTRKTLPKEWQCDGGRLILRQDGIHGCSVTVFVNGEKAGVIAAPAGELDITRFAKFGLENEFHLFLTGNGQFRLNGNPPLLIAKGPVTVENVFANTSWREKKLTVEVVLSSTVGGTAEVEAEVLDAQGKTVKRLSGRYEIKEGTNIFSPSVEWTDPITWELGRGYLYTLKTSVVARGQKLDCDDVLFGFREIWREGRKIFMNGHEQKFRVAYNFGCNKYGAKFLQGLGYNCIQYAHQTSLDPILNVENLKYLSENGIAAIVPTTAFDWNTKQPLLKPGEKREEFKRQQAANLQRYRNWPCIAMVYMGVNCYLPQWSYEAKYLGCGDASEFGEMMKDLVAAAKTTNPNVLYYSHSDGSTGEIASANLYFNWVPLQERVEWPSAWADKTGKFPFQACEFGHPYQQSWYQDGRDIVTELLAIYYGEEAYRTEPEKISDRHVESLYIRRLLHPLLWRFTDDFVTRLTRAWRTYGINAGIVWFNLDYGFGMPGWELEKIYNKYGVAYNFFKSEEDVPKGRPEWAFPSWDIYRKTNLDFLGWIGGAVSFTDTRHAYTVGETVEKQCIFLWDGFDTRAFSAKWTATLGGKEIASGEFSRELVSNIPSFAPFSFSAPAVAAKSTGKISAEFFDSQGQKLSEDAFAFEVYPAQKVSWQETPGFVLYDPAGTTAAELKSRGVSNFKVVDSLDAVGEARFLVVGVDALGEKGGFGALPMKAVKAGLRVLVLRQSADAWKSFGFDVQDRASRRLFLRDTLSPALARLDDDSLHDWSGASPELRVKHRRHEPRWKGSMSLAALQLKSPSVVGYRPQIEGEFDMNYSALLDYSVGKGGVKFCTLDFFARGATDAAVEHVFAAVLGDFLAQGAAEDTAGASAVRAVVVGGAEARKIAGELGASISANAKADAGDILLVGKDASIPAEDVLAAVRRGANVLVVDNRAVAKGLGLHVSPSSGEGVYRVAFDPKSPVLRGVGQAQLRWRDRLKYDHLSGEGWTIDAEGLVASKTLSGGGMIIVTSFSPYAIERGITPDRVLVVDGVKRDRPLAMVEAWEKPPERAKTPSLDLDLGAGVTGLSLDDEEVEKKKLVVDEKKLAEAVKRADISFERSRQLVARLLTNLGAASAEPAKLYSGLIDEFDPYSYSYW